MGKKVKLNLDTGCHEIIGTKSEYPTVTVEGKPIPAHRLAYMLYVGHIPKGRLILHKCDNNRCINPAHLYAGTQKDNVKDMLEPGRWGVTSIKQVNLPKNPDCVIRQPIIRQGKIQPRAPLKSPRTASALSPGQDHATAKLTEEQVYEIRASTLPGVELARIYGVAPSAISKIRNRYSWRHLP